jgi:repressor LexA
MRCWELVLSKRDIGQLIKKARLHRTHQDKKKYTQEHLAGDIGVSRSYVGDIEAGRRYPNYVILAKIAQACNVGLDFFSDAVDSKIIQIKEMKKIPILGTIRAGEPMMAEQNIIDYMELPEQYTNGEYFGLRVTGDSMNLFRLLEGDIALVRRQSFVENGEIAVVLVDGEEATIKQFFCNDSMVTLVPHSSNVNHQPQIIDTSKINTIVLGKVVRAIINF